MGTINSTTWSVDLRTTIRICPWCSWGECKRKWLMHWLASPGECGHWHSVWRKPCASCQRRLCRAWSQWPPHFFARTQWQSHHTTPPCCHEGTNGGHSICFCGVSFWSSWRSGVCRTRATWGSEETVTSHQGAAWCSQWCDSCQSEVFYHIQWDAGHQQITHGQEKSDVPYEQVTRQLVLSSLRKVSTLFCQNRDMKVKIIGIKSNQIINQIEKL